MKTPPPFQSPRCLRRAGVCALAALALFVCLLLLPTPASAQSQGSAAITGRVFNSSTGEYLNNARVRLDEYAQETFTDSSGQYTFSKLNPGSFKIEVLFTGLGTQAATVNVSAVQTTTRDFTFAFKDAGAESKTGSDAIVLDAFSVTASKEMNGAAIAINEQRFADNFKTVVSADEFGTQPEGNVGEFMKFLPGVSIDYNGGEPRVISLNGAPSNNVPITVGGFGLASASSGNTNRQVELEQMSVNNLSRIEVNFSPTPETSGSALAGSVNLVPRQAFERSHPEFNFTGFLIARSTDLYLAPQPGPFQSKERRVRPGFEFSYLNPVSQRFGFTISAANSTVFTGQNFFQNTWRGVSAATGGNFPLTTVDQPYLSQIYTYRVEKFSTRSSVGATLDFKVSERDAFAFNFNYAHFWAEWNGPRMQYDINKALSGNVGLTSVHSNASVTDGAKVELSNRGRRKYGQTIMPTLTWRHKGPTWKADLGLGYSTSAPYDAR